MRPLLFLALGTAGLAWAQFTGLTATEDGSIFYFSSQFRLRGASQSFDGKIFRLDSTGPGSIVALTGLGLSELNQSAPPPLVGALGDVRIVIGDSDVPVAAISPDVVWFQLPWELPPQDYKFEFLSGSSPFETGPDTITVQAVAPEFFQTMNGDGSFAVKAVHGDWSALVNSDNPAHGGETIYLYMAGLGPVNPPVPTGSASPDTPPSQITGALSCQFLDGLIHDATIFFAGLAPGMVGIYQVSLQIPMDLRGPGYAIGIICGFGSESSAFGNIYAAP